MGFDKYNNFTIAVRFKGNSVYKVFLSQQYIGKHFFSKLKNIAMLLYIYKIL